MEQTNSTLTLDDAIQLAKREVTDGYAQTYLSAIDKAIELGGVQGLATQLAYALSNMKSWHGDNARTAKATMRQWLEREYKFNSNSSASATHDWRETYNLDALQTTEIKPL
jgi:hypothetical protein